MPYNATISRSRYFGGQRPQAIESISIYSLDLYISSKINRLRILLGIHCSIFITAFIAIMVYWTINVGDTLVLRIPPIFICMIICSPLIRWGMITFDNMSAWENERKETKEQISFLGTLGDEGLLATPPLFHPNPRIHRI